MRRPWHPMGSPGPPPHTPYTRPTIVRSVHTSPTSPDAAQPQPERPPSATSPAPAAARPAAAPPAAAAPAELAPPVINVAAAVRGSLAPYDGDASFLAGPTKRTQELWEEIEASGKEVAGGWTVRWAGECVHLGGGGGEARPAQPPRPPPTPPHPPHPPPCPALPLPSPVPASGRRRSRPRRSGGASWTWTPPCPAASPPSPPGAAPSLQRWTHWRWTHCVCVVCVGGGRGRGGRGARPAVSHLPCCRLQSAHPTLHAPCPPLHARPGRAATLRRRRRSSWVYRQEGGRGSAPPVPAVPMWTRPAGVPPPLAAHPLCSPPLPLLIPGQADAPLKRAIKPLVGPSPAPARVDAACRRPLLPSPLARSPSRPATSRHVLVCRRGSSGTLPLPSHA